MNMRSYSYQDAALTMVMSKSFSALCAALFSWTVIPAVAEVPAPGGASAENRSAPIEHPQGWSDLSYYLAMPDGGRVAVSVWFPGGKPPSQRVPVILIQTRYGRNGVYIHGENGQYPKFVGAGYAVAIVDTRGTTSSFGAREVEIGPRERADMDVLIRHFKQQSWSTGEVIATGVSYMADTADMACASPAGLTAAIVRESDFDAYQELFNPGGIANDGMMNVWGGDTLPRDYGRSSNPQEGLDCAARAADCSKLWPRLQPVDGDIHYEQLRAALASRTSHWQPDDYRTVEFRDDKARNGFTYLSSSPAGYIKEINRQRIPAQYWGSWMDAGTADAALSRYRSTPDTTVEVWLTAHNHGNDRLTDPFFPDATTPIPAFAEQVATMLSFVARARAHTPQQRIIHYYVLGAKTFKSTDTWPPRGTQPLELRFGPEQTLLRPGAAATRGTDQYDVDFSATSGEATRWTTQLGVPAAYTDRRAQDAKLLSYTTAPFEQAVELAGSPSLHLFVATQSNDPAFFAYLEDVAPDGRSTYLTEGLFRAIHRKAAHDSKQLPYPLPAPAKSYLRSDALPMTPGVAAEVAFPLFPIAALIQPGHRLRISLAGADTSMFRRYSNGRPDTWTVYRSPEQPSRLQIDTRPWPAAE